MDLRNMFFRVSLIPYTPLELDRHIYFFKPCLPLMYRSHHYKKVAKAKLIIQNFL